MAVDERRGPTGGGGPWRFPAALMHAAARLYYLEDATQAEVARRLGISRSTVSRLLTEARRAGIARIEVIAPVDQELDELADATARALGLDLVHLSALTSGATVGERLAPALSQALRGLGLQTGDVLLVSSGRTVYEAAQASLPALPGVLLTPTIGGQDEPEVWYAPNEITRQVAARVGGTPTFLYAPALPAPRLHDALVEDPGFLRVQQLWGTAHAAVMGIGAPPLRRASLPRFVPRDGDALRGAVGDVCSRFFDADGQAVSFPGSERLIATPLETLRDVPAVIGVAAGADKLQAIRVAAHAGYIDQLVTDTDTATSLLTHTV